MYQYTESFPNTNTPIYKATPDTVHSSKQAVVDVDEVL